MAISVSAQTTLPTTQPSNTALQLQRVAEEAAIFKQISTCPQLPPAKIDDVFTLGIDHGHISLTSRLAPTGTQSRIQIIGLPGLCTLTSRQMLGTAVPNLAYPPDFFLLEWYRFDEPGLADTATTVEGLPTSVHISWMGEANDNVSQIQLLDQVTPIGAGSSQTPPNIVLRASIPQKNGEPDVQIELKARDYLTLRREHPAEVELYLGPIFRALHADSALLQSDTVLAWQVFASDVKPDAQLIQIIHKLVARLDADDYKDRDNAAKELEKIGPIAGIELSRMDRSKFSPEQTNRADGIVNEFHPVSDEMAGKLKTDRAFLLTCLQDNDDFIAGDALKHLQKISPELSLDLSLKGQPRLDAIAKLRMQVYQAAPAK